MLLIFLLSLHASAMTCQKYGCPSVGVTFASLSACTNQTKSFISLRSCSTGQTCNLSTGNCTTTATSVSANYPGEVCTISTDCVSANCTNQICIGKALNAVCTDDGNCNPGLRCLNSKCQSQLNIGQTGCYNDYDCVNSAGCNVTTDGSLGTCLEYLSVSTGLTVTDCSGGVSRLCKSSECYKTASFGSYGVCKLATQSIASLPTNCSSNTDCLGTDGKYTYTGTCTCGYNSNGTAYCNPFNGDLPGQAYYQSWKNAINASAVCNTVRRFSTSCLARTGFLNKVTQMTWGFLMYPLIQNNDLCVQEVITSEYYEPISFAAHLVLFLGIYLG